MLVLAFRAVLAEDSFDLGVVHQLNLPDVFFLKLPFVVLVDDLEPTGDQDRIRIK